MAILSDPALHSPFFGKKSTYQAEYQLLRALRIQRCLLSTIPLIRQRASKQQSTTTAACPCAILAHRLQALLSDMDFSADQMQKAAPSAQPERADTTLILQAIEQSKTSMLVRIDYLTAECTQIRNDLDKISGSLTEAESSVAAMEDTTAQHDQLLQSLQQKIHTLIAKSDDAKNRQHRNNARVLGLPEGTKGEHAVEFAEPFFKDLLGLTDLSVPMFTECQWVASFRVPHPGHS